MFKFFKKQKKELNDPVAAAGAATSDDDLEEIDGDAIYHHDDDIEEDEHFYEESNESSDSDGINDISEEDSEDFRGKARYAKEFEDDSRIGEAADEVSRAISEENEDGYCYGYYGLMNGSGKRVKRATDEEVKEDTLDEIAAMRAATACLACHGGHSSLAQPIGTCLSSQIQAALILVRN